MTGASSCRLTYHYEEGIRPTHATCRGLIGFWARTLELAGAGTVVAEHPVCIAEKAIGASSRSRGEECP